jgi:carboxylesterase
VVPVGLSGTGKAFPPEAYPRLQEWPLPRPEPIEVRFGDPIWFRKRTDEEISYEQLRGMTSKVMRSISQLVNHTMGYESMTVPVEEREVKTPVPKTPYRSKVRDEKARLGVLVLHGFTSDVSCVADLRFPLDEMGIPYRIPILRGHGKGKEWQALAGVQAQDWYDDAEASMFDLLTECRKVVVVGLSMGGLVALDLAARHRKQVAAVVTIAAALRFKDPLSCLTPVLARVVSSWPSPRAFTDRNLEKERNRNYPRFPTKAFHELYRYAADMENRLSFVVADALILQSKKDTVVHPKAANIIHEKISSKRKTLAWFEESGHEMLLDLEAPAVLKTIAEYVKEVVATSPPDGE